MQTRWRVWFGLVGIWLLGVGCDRLWYALDRGVPDWDRADYLNGALNYWHALQSPDWLSGDWWHHLWLLSSKIPPGTYIATAFCFKLFGTTPDAGSLILSGYSLLLLVGVFGLGQRLFSTEVGLLAALLCQLLPGLYRYRTAFLLDYPVAAMVTLCFCCLTLWYCAKGRSRSWSWAIAFGITFGAALMVKQTALLFLLVPILWAFATYLWDKQWGRLLQLLAGLTVSLPIFYPWYRTNWLLILTSGKRATLDSAIAEGDPPLNTLDAWIYYAKILPYLLSIPLILVPLVGWWHYRNSLATETDRYWQRLGIQREKFKERDRKQRWWWWLGAFFVGGYLLCSLNVNKDARYILPLLPVFSLILARGLLFWQGGWRTRLRWGALGVAIALAACNLFPLGGGWLTQALSPRVRHHPEVNASPPHREVIAEIARVSPYLQTTLGVLPSTETINQHNLTLYGTIADFQVYGRQVGVRASQVEADGRSLSWFLTKTGDPGLVPASYEPMSAYVKTNRAFQLQRQWQLRDGSALKLYRRRQLPVTVTPAADSIARALRLEVVSVPERVPPGVPIPVTYRWLGEWEELRSGLVLLTWESQRDRQSQFWWHDRAIARGRLRGGIAGNTYRVQERTAMFPGADIAPGIYQLRATYLDRRTGKTYPIATPEVRVAIAPDAPAPDSYPLDLVTQLRLLAARLPEGENALDAIFAETARINQYDPTQVYLAHAERALEHRLQRNEPRRELVYTLVLARVLQRDVPGAIAALQQAIALDSQNPYAYAYLAFVYLYDWQGREAEKVLKEAIALAPELQILRSLDGVAALMQGNLIKAVRLLLANSNAPISFTYK